MELGLGNTGSAGIVGMVTGGGNTGLGLGLGPGLGLGLQRFLSIDPGIELELTVFVTSRR